MCALCVCVCKVQGELVIHNVIFLHAKADANNLKSNYLNRNESNQIELIIIIIGLTLDGICFEEAF